LKTANRSTSVNQVPNEKGEIRFISEEKVWSIFLCMAKALNAMSIGNEDPRLVKTAQDTRYIHFDIKPANSKFLPRYRAKF
jgi:hypothetical protein